MSLSLSAPETLYPDSDGKPMADKTKQFYWIGILMWELDALLPADFVAGDLLWYPREGQTIRQAPDVLIALGRPKGHRGSYKQWEEDGIAPQVVFEILSPGNRAGEMQNKLEFYERYGVEEYYLYDPDEFHLSGWVREGAHLRLIDPVDGWVSPRLGIRFDAPGDRDMTVCRPDGVAFRPPSEVRDALAEAQAELERLRTRLREIEDK
jgi:Uma2 family endonuclease